jgi:hypothetical protein
VLAMLVVVRGEPSSLVFVGWVCRSSEWMVWCSGSRCGVDEGIEWSKDRSILYLVGTC